MNIFKILRLALWGIPLAWSAPLFAHHHDLNAAIVEIPATACTIINGNARYLSNGTIQTSSAATIECPNIYKVTRGGHRIQNWTLIERSERPDDCFSMENYTVRCHVGSGYQIVGMRYEVRSVDGGYFDSHSLPAATQCITYPSGGRWVSRCPLVRNEKHYEGDNVVVNIHTPGNTSVDCWLFSTTTFGNLTGEYSYQSSTGQSLGLPVPRLEDTLFAECVMDHGAYINSIEYGAP